MNTATQTSKPAGFTLIELLIVVVVLGIVTALGAPPLQGYIEANRIVRARDQLVADLAHARMRAMSEARSVSLCLLPGAEYVIVRNLADPATCTGESELKRIRLQQDYPGVAVTVNGSTAAFSFDSRGLSRNASTQQVDVKVGSRTKSFRITPIGTVQRL